MIAHYKNIVYNHSFVKSEQNEEIRTRLSRNMVDGISKLAKPLVKLVAASYTEQWSALAPAGVLMLGGKSSCSSSMMNSAVRKHGINPRILQICTISSHGVLGLTPLAFVAGLLKNPL